MRYSSILGGEGRRRAERAAGESSAAGAGLELVSIFDSEEYESITGAKSSGSVEECAERRFAVKDPVEGFQIFDMNNFLQHLLLRADRMTMAHSLEAREPFLDNALVEFAFSLPRNGRAGFFLGKRLLRKAVKDVLPREVTSRRKNRFFVPIHDWFKSELGEFFWQEMERPRLGIYRRQYLQRLESNYDESPLYYARQMWSMLNLELWYETFFPGEEFVEPLRIVSKPQTIATDAAPLLT